MQSILVELIFQLLEGVFFNLMNIFLATVNDIADIMSFINSEWKENHILAKDESFFRYEHQNHDNVNFIISKNEEMKLNGVLGFIPSALEEKSDVNTVIWKVSKNNNNPVLGIQLLQYLKTLKNIRNILSVGINKKTIGIYQYLGMYTGTLHQYVMINRDIKEFEIAKIENFKDFHTFPVSDEKYHVKLLQESDLLQFDFEQFRDNITFKNEKYFIKRYFQHPIYKYKVYGIYESDKIFALVVTRIQNCNDSKILRIVDYIGEDIYFEKFGSFFSDMLSKEGYEYVDFYCFGLDSEIIKKAGFHFIDISKQDLIIPNYFSPFVQENIPIHFFADTDKIDCLRLFKADGDQDRPN